MAIQAKLLVQLPNHLATCEHHQSNCLLHWTLYFHAIEQVMQFCCYLLCYIINYQCCLSKCIKQVLFWIILSLLHIYYLLAIYPSVVMCIIWQFLCYIYCTRVWNFLLCSLQYSHESCLVCSSPRYIIVWLLRLELICFTGILMIYNGKRTSNGINGDLKTLTVSKV